MLRDYNICDGFYQNAIKEKETKYFNIGNLHGNVLTRLKHQEKEGLLRCQGGHSLWKVALLLQNETQKIWLEFISASGAGRSLAGRQYCLVLLSLPQECYRNGQRALKSQRLTVKPTVDLGPRATVSLRLTRPASKREKRIGGRICFLSSSSSPANSLGVGTPMEGMQSRLWAQACIGKLSARAAHTTAFPVASVESQSQACLELWVIRLLELLYSVPAAVALRSCATRLSKQNILTSSRRNPTAFSIHL